MGAINAIIGYPLGWIMWFCYLVIRNYGFALILFTILTKLMTFPLMLKQQKSSVKMAMIKPKLDAIQAKYANNKEKLQEEMMKLYQEEGYNPMSGCLPLLIQFPILFGLIDVIYKPLTHIIRAPSDAIEKGIEVAKGLGMTVNLSMPQISVIQAIKSDAADFIPIFGQDIVNKISTFNLSFLGLDLAETPTFALAPLIIIPILSGVTSFLLAIQSSKQQAMTAPEGAAGGGMMKGMMYVMPVFSLMFTFQVPAGVGLYWIISNVYAYIQTIVLNRKFNPQETAERVRRQQEELAEKERQEKLEARKKAKEEVKDKSLKDIKELAEVDPSTLKKALSAKEINRIKLAQARKRDAEKYGEEYVEVTDEDLM